jgi:glutamate N-acetyltransferase / amino-acid N-acetyltransferase
VTIRRIPGGVTAPRGLRAATPIDFDERAASRALRGRVVEIGLEMGVERGAGMEWSCDLSAEYVAINSEYRT